MIDVDILIIIFAMSCAGVIGMILTLIDKVKQLELMIHLLDIENSRLRRDMEIMDITVKRLKEAVFIGEDISDK